MKLKLDENLSRKLREPLRELGFDATTAVEEGLQGRPDTEVGEVASREGRMILTLDLEFADLRKYPPGGHPGVILFRPGSMGPRFVNRFVLEFVRENDVHKLERCVVVVEATRIRIRRPPLDTEGEDWQELTLD